jgi:hypothetical protein
MVSQRLPVDSGSENKMTDYHTKYVLKPAASVLELGEEVLAGTPCLPRGAITTRAAGAFLGAGGVALAGQSARSGTVYQGQKLPSVMALGLTNKRVLIFKMNGFTGRPNKVLFTIPVEQIAGVRSAQGKAVGMKMLKFDIVFADESALALDVAREHMKHGQEFVELLADATAALGGIAE